MLTEFLAPITIPAPTASGHAVNRSYLEANYDSSATIAATYATKASLDAAIQGIDWKDAVKYKTQAGDLAGFTYANGVLTAPDNLDHTVDGASLDGMDPGTRILVTSVTDTGIYTLTRKTAGQTQAIQLTRAEDMDTAAEAGKMVMVPVQLGTDAGKWYYISNIADLAATDPEFTQWTGITYTADGNGIELNGTTFSLELDGTTLTKGPNGLKVAAGGITSNELAVGAAVANIGAGGITSNELANGSVTAAKKQSYTTKFGDGAATSFDINHNLGVENCKVTVKRRADNVIVGCTVKLAKADGTGGDNWINLSGFAQPPALNELEVFIEPVSARAA